MNDLGDLSEGAQTKSARFSATSGTPSASMGVEAEREIKHFSYHTDELNKCLVSAEKQKVWLRWISIGVALLAIAGFGYLELLLLRYAMSSSFGLGDLFFVWAISPMVSITAIMIFILIGVFRGFRGAEVDGMPNYANKLLGGNSPEE